MHSIRRWNLHGNQRECANKWLPDFGHESQMNGVAFLQKWENGETKEEFQMKMEIFNSDKCLRHIYDILFGISSRFVAINHGVLS